MKLIKKKVLNAKKVPLYIDVLHLSSYTTRLILTASGVSVHVDRGVEPRSGKTSL